jgi:spore coat protein A
MKWSRRDVLSASGKIALAQTIGIVSPLGCSGGRPLPTLLPSRVPLPAKFRVDLPKSPLLTPIKQDASADYYDLHVRETTANILPGLKTQIWGYDGLFPGPTIEARSGRKSIIKLHNDLPVPIVNHLHGGHTPPESDGYPTDLILPARGWEAAHTHDPRANTVERVRDYIYPNNQRAAMLWYHDHRMDFTGPQVWRGLAGLYLIRDEEEGKLPLPRDEKEITLFMCDRSFDSDGSLLYPSIDPSLRGVPGVTHAYMGGVLGDTVLVNGAPWPRLEVSNTRYRFRILNASNARRYELDLSPRPNAGPAFVQIGSDGGLLSTPLAQRTISISPAERFDVIVDFSKFPMGSRVVLKNKLGSDATLDIMCFDIVEQERDEGAIPERLSVIPPVDVKAAAAVRTFDFTYGGMSQGWLINGKPFDPTRMDAQPRANTTEVWKLRTDIHHPLHLHLVQFRVLGHSGRPRPADSGWKDTVDLSAGETANVLVRFADYRGRYVFHCHNLEHEDMTMMGNFEVV